jgi:hypothetical protein
MQEWEKQKLLKTTYQNIFGVRNMEKYGKITLPIDVIKKIDWVCERGNTNRTELIRCLVWEFIKETLE